MNIQIFGKRKCFDTKKAVRFFKERNIKFQEISLEEKGISKGELNSVINSVGDLDILLDEKTKNKDALLLIKYSPEETKIEKILEHPEVLKTPIVRNKNQATIGYKPDIWKKWIEN